MQARPQALPLDPATLPGLSERLLRSHHQNNYGGAVARLNAIRAQLSGLDFASTPGFVVNGLKREELIASNSMLLHELYFGSLGGGGAAPAPGMLLALGASFGSAERWREEFVAMGKALGGGSGWVLLVFQPRDGTLVNQWASDHTQAAAGGVPILALDMYEHAYHLDFGTNAAAYVDACLAAIDWGGVYARYKTAVHAASEGFGADHDDISNSRVLDVRRAGIFEQVTTQLPGAAWCDPAAPGGNACQRLAAGGLQHGAAAAGTRGAAAAGHARPDRARRRGHAAKLGRLAMGRQPAATGNHRPRQERLDPGALERTAGLGL